MNTTLFNVPNQEVIELKIGIMMLGLGYILVLIWAAYTSVGYTLN